MSENNNSENMLMIINAACKVPGVKIDREKYLRSQFEQYYPMLINDVIKKSPHKAGVPQSIIDKAAKASINFETTKATAIAVGLGLPGGLAMIGAIPADLAQFYAHVLRVMQKLMYLYGWGDIGDLNTDDGTKNVLIIFLGVMFGVEGAINGVKKLAEVAGPAIEKMIAAKALTQGTLYPIIKKILTKLGFHVTKETFAKAVAKGIPIIGGVINGGLTFATFKPMSKRLMKVLKQNQIG